LLVVTHSKRSKQRQSQEVKPHGEENFVRVSCCNHLCTAKTVQTNPELAKAVTKWCYRAHGIRKINRYDAVPVYCFQETQTKGFGACHFQGETGAL
jgi:hypothetical protein